MGLRRARIALIALAAPALVAIATSGALAQSKPQPKPRAGARAPTPKKPAAGDVGGGAGASQFGASVTAQPVPGTSVGSSVDAGYVEAKTADGGAHVFKFSELDIEGRLKSPQLVYFLRRVRAEFAAGDLGHRSFMREMSETRKESSF
jgi:hypothetical protein